ncbi:helix-turn-helix transcriptional regulator [Ferruginibacter sp. HRS2-29]|uniref:helix-turn-helix transcriptional regulator n=1 Tax=Ferruginibacter sp. HRS2-29 TaxID=2487334 RepID=UPI0020CFAAB1|nr:XRE family transcriptional regulator [Ferruginibacter sp. HRS2-29]
MDKQQLQIKIGKRIIELRESIGWSQADLARACMKDRQAIERLESGKGNPTLYTLYELANAMEMKLSAFTDDF